MYSVSVAVPQQCTNVMHNILCFKVFIVSLLPTGARVFMLLAACCWFGTPNRCTDLGWSTIRISEHNTNFDHCPSTTSSQSLDWQSAGVPNCCTAVSIQWIGSYNNICSKYGSDRKAGACWGPFPWHQLPGDFEFTEWNSRAAPWTRSCNSHIANR